MQIPSLVAGHNMYFHLKLPGVTSRFTGDRVTSNLAGTGDSEMSPLTSDNLAEEGRRRRVGGGVRVIAVERFVGEGGMEDKLTSEPLFNPEEIRK